MLLNTATVKNMGDLFTKGLPREKYEYFQNKLMGW